MRPVAGAIGAGAGALAVAVIDALIEGRRAVFLAAGTRACADAESPPGG